MKILILAIALLASSHAYSKQIQVPDSEVEAYKRSIIEAYWALSSKYPVTCRGEVTRSVTKKQPYNLDSDTVQDFIKKAEIVFKNTSGAQPSIRLIKNLPSPPRDGDFESLDVLITTNSEYTEILSIQLQHQSSSYFTVNENVGTIIEPKFEDVIKEREWSRQVIAVTCAPQK